MYTRVAHAKINLALHVTGLRADGYHLLDTLVSFTEYGDKITILRAASGQNAHSLEITGPFGNMLSAKSDNLVLKAAELYSEIVSANGEQYFPVHIQLEKNLPIASGIGGGSADAAATLLALKEIWQSRTEPFSVAEKLGADVPMCLYSKPLHARGIGDHISLIPNMREMHMVLVNPLVEVSTQKIFNALKTKNNPAITEDNLIKMRNDLQTSAIELEPVIFDVLATLKDQNPIFARMSGSGATCFAVFENAQTATSVKEYIADQHPEWWSIATKTVAS